MGQSIERNETSTVVFGGPMSWIDPGPSPDMDERTFAQDVEILIAWLRRVLRTRFPGIGLVPSVPHVIANTPAAPAPTASLKLRHLVG